MLKATFMGCKPKFPTFWQSGQFCKLTRSLWHCWFHKSIAGEKFHCQPPAAPFRRRPPFAECVPEIATILPGRSRPAGPQQGTPKKIESFAATNTQVDRRGRARRRGAVRWLRYPHRHGWRALPVRAPRSFRSQIWRSRRPAQSGNRPGGNWQSWT